MKIFTVKVLFPVFLFLPVLAKGQIIRGTLPAFRTSTLSLYGFSGIDTFKIAEARIGSNGSFRFPQKFYPTGFYRLLVNDTSYLDIILNNEKQVELRSESGFTSVEFRQSKENQLLNELKQYRKKQSLAKQEIALKNPDSLRQKAKVLDMEFYSFAKKLADENPETFFASTTRSIIPFVSEKTDEKHRKEEEKRHFFDNIDFSDPSFSRTTIIPNLVWKYLQTHCSFSESEFIEACRVIMEKASQHPENLKVTLSFLLDTFKKLEQLGAFEYLVLNYYKDNQILHRPDAEKVLALQVGAIAPELIIPPGFRGPDAAGSDFSLLYFWSLHCQYCLDAIDTIANIHRKYSSHGLRVTGIALDTDEKELFAATSALNIKWNNIPDPESTAPSNKELFMIFRTPSFFLLDKDQRIVKKGYGASDLLQAVEETLGKR